MAPRQQQQQQEYVVPTKNCHRMVVLGSSKVGKTALVARFLTGRYEDTYTPTIEDFHRKLYRIRGELYQLDVLDTSGNHPFPAMRRLSILTGDIFVLVFSLDNRESLHEACRLREQILQTKACLRNRPTHSLDDVPIVICANKAEPASQQQQQLAPGAAAAAGDSPGGQQQLQLAPGAAAAIAAATTATAAGDSPGGADPSQPPGALSRDEVLAALGAGVPYFEVSAKRNHGVDEMFHALFTLAGLPREMSPALHRRVSALPCPGRGGGGGGGGGAGVEGDSDCDGQPGGHGKSSLCGGSGSKAMDAWGLVATCARRPSVHSDLLYVRQKALLCRSQSKERSDKCCIM
ncbi:dexamethasone-induced Ras-related protein 1 [Petromyzon marinus]|uniref:dexamethasone-induced Ras-related protein 1 n=1 Tax=Petromyzon marinus TaxID=7757 RepID=UPI003F719E1A